MRQIDAIKIYQRKNCLIIDDMSEVRGSLKRMLMTFGLASIDTAATSEQAMELCAEKSYDLVLCDYNLGDGQDGQQVLEAMRYTKLLKNASMFLMITAETSRDMVLGALEYLPDDYLTKPITQNMLQTRLTRIVIRHEDLLTIKQAIDEQDFEKAIRLCQEKIDSEGKYTSSYKRIQAELLFRLRRFEPAQTIYEESLRDANPVWAQLGLGKTYLAQKRYNDAEIALKKVVATDNRFVEAHDLLAEVYAEQADYISAQKAMQQAAEVSPKSVLRQRRLAIMAKHNGDTTTRFEARKKALKVGEHSCYYTPQDYFDMVSELLASDDEDVDQRLKNAKDAKMYINRAEKKHTGDHSIKLQATAAKSRLAQYQKKTQEAAELLAQAKALQSHNDSALAELELAQAMADNGDKEGASALIRKVAAANPDSEELADRVDAMSDEPVSAKGRKMAAELTRKGIKLYEDKQFDESVDVFQRAISLFPNHIGLRLNIIQVALSKAKAKGNSKSLESICRNNLTAIESLEETSPQYTRYEFLQKQSLSFFGP